MNEHQLQELQELLIGVFSTLRQNGSAITISELLDGLRVAISIEGPVPLRHLEESLRLLWGGDGEFKAIWESQVSQYASLSLLISGESREQISTNEATPSFSV